jgi:hypothetical protein
MGRALDFSVEWLKLHGNIIGKSNKKPRKKQLIFALTARRFVVILR